MSASTTLAEVSQGLHEGLVWIVYQTRETWDALARSASGEGLGGASGAVAAPGPAVVLMAGGLTTLAAVMTLYLARHSLSSTPDPVNTRGSRKKARESVDIYVDGEDEDSPSELEAAIVTDPDRDPDRGEASTSPATSPRWTVVHSRVADPAGDSQQSASTQAGSPRTVAGAELEEREPATPRRDPEAGSPEAFQRGRSAGQRVRASDADEVLDALRAANLGQPTVRESTPNLYEIRLDGCRGCQEGPEDPRREPSQGCPFEAGFLEGAMSEVLPGAVVVRETACRRRGADACVFEVWS